MPRSGMWQPGGAVANGAKVRENVFWANTAALMRAADIFPLQYIVPSPVGSDVPSASLIAPVPEDMHTRPFRCDCIEKLDYPPHMLEVVFVSAGDEDSMIEAVRRRVDGLRGLGFVARLDEGPGRRSPITAMENAVEASQADFVILSDLMSALPPDIVRKAAKVFLDSLSDIPSPPGPSI